MTDDFKNAYYTLTAAWTEEAERINQRFSAEIAAVVMAEEKRMTEELELPILCKASDFLPGPGACRWGVVSTHALDVGSRVWYPEKRRMATVTDVFVRIDTHTDDYYCHTDGPESQGGARARLCFRAKVDPSPARGFDGGTFEATGFQLAKGGPMHMLPRMQNDEE